MKRKEWIYTVAFIFVAATCLLEAGVLAAYSPALLAGGIKVQLLTASPNGRWEAYTEKAGTLDGPEYYLSVQPADRRRFKYVADLPGEAVSEIRWSPDSSIAVFIAPQHVVAVCLPAYDILQIPISPASGQKVEVDFPSAGLFRLRVGEQSRIVRLDELFEAQ